MIRTTLTTGAAIVAGAALLTAGAVAMPGMDGGDAVSVQQTAVTKKNITITNPWVRVVPPGSANTAGYMVIRSKGVNDALIKASVPMSFAMMTELHRSIMDPATGQMTMVQQKSIPVPRNGARALKMGDYHLMIMGLKGNVTAGQKVPITLTFRRAGTVKVTAMAREM